MEDTKIIFGPVITEKATDNQAKGLYSFYVRPTATKVEIKQALKALYGVEIVSVQTQRLPSKVRQLARGRHLTKRPTTKKAIVQVKGKKPLDFNQLKTAK